MADEILLDFFRHRHAANRRVLFNPRGNVHSITQHILAVAHDIALVNADAQVQMRHATYLVLNSQRAFHRGERTVEAEQQAVANFLQPLPLKSFHDRLEQTPLLLDELERHLFIAIGQGGVAHNIREHNRRQLAPRLGWRLFVVIGIGTGRPRAGLAEINDPRIVLLQGLLLRLACGGIQFLLQGRHPLRQLVLTLCNLNLLIRQRLGAINPPQLPALPRVHHQVLQLKIRKVQQAHQVNGQQNHRGPGSTHVDENTLVQQQPHIPTGIHCVQLLHRPAEQVRVQAQARRDGQHEGQGPRPTLAQALKLVDQEPQRENQHQRRQQIRRHAQRHEATLRQPRAERARVVVQRVIDLRAVERQVTPIKGIQRQQEQPGQSHQAYAENLVSASLG